MNSSSRDISGINALRKILKKKPSGSKIPYAVPAIWLTGRNVRTSRAILNQNPYKIFLNSVDFIQGRTQRQKVSGKGGSWSRKAIVYNMFVRTTSAFDHNQNGRLDLPVNEYGFRETGSFLKSLAMLPYIQSLGVNTIHLLPVTSIGSDGNKGTLGSPYAIRNPYELDANLSEPNLGLSAEEEFKAFVEAAHHLGIRVVVEFVFRTAAKDGDWIREHPEWFYWIREEIRDRPPGSHDEESYGSPLFHRDELERIKKSAESHSRYDLLPPHDSYRSMFTQPPHRDTVRKSDGRYVGTLADGRRVRIPGAFADWPPDDSQPPWGDVTYLKMYVHQDFNYIAYNTIRMYDERLTRRENINQELWERIVNIIPYYQRSFGIDGVMIDMGHALPADLKHEMVRKARELDPDFAFWDENFSVNEESVREGYNAVIGYQWSDQHHPDRFRRLVERFAGEGFPLPFFATAESHNTPRAAARPGGTKYSRYAWAVGCFLPAIPFIHSGFEIGEKYPINTGLDFTQEELRAFPSEKLPLFSEYAYDWTSKAEITNWIRAVSRVRARHEKLITDSGKESFAISDAGNPEIIAFNRSKKGIRERLLILANSSMDRNNGFTLQLETRKRSLRDLITGRKSFRIREKCVKGELAPAEVVVLEL